MDGNISDENLTNLAATEWLEQMKSRLAVRQKSIAFLAENMDADECRIKNLDPTLKKVTGFMKRVKGIGASASPDSLLPDLGKLNLSKFVDEIASSVCDAKIKVEDLGSLVEFCVRAASVYSTFSPNLLAELKKRMPLKKSDKIANPSKLRVDLKFLSELILHGVLKSEGIQLLGSVLSYLIQTDKNDHVNIPILLPFCRSNLFDFSALLPLRVQETATVGEVDVSNVLSPAISEAQRSAIANLFTMYMDSLIEHMNNVRLKMNGVLKYIKRQERTRGDASAEDRQQYEDLKTMFDRLLAQSGDLAQCVGRVVPDMPEELSDDEPDQAEAKKLNTELNEGRTSLFPDDETRLFYENLANVELAALQAGRGDSPVIDDEVADEPDDFVVADQIEESVDNVDVEDLDSEAEEAEEEIVEDEHNEIPQQQASQPAAAAPPTSSSNPLDNREASTISTNITAFLNKLSNAINKERIDGCALEFITHFNRKANRKRVVQHLLAAPYDRLDLLPFYCRFLATIRPVIPDVPMQVTHKLLEQFRKIAGKKVEIKNKGAKDPDAVHVDAKVHLAKYISELVKFGLLPKAESLACLRSLLVDLRHHKVDMLSAMVESMGIYLYRSAETHAKMKVIVNVLLNKSQKIKDTRQKLLLENAYFYVLPMEEEQNVALYRRPPLEEYIIKKVLTSSKAENTLRRLDWCNEGVREFTLSLLSDACAVPFASLERLAKMVSIMAGRHDWIGVTVVDDVLEYIRVALEENAQTMHQRLMSSVVYLGQLFNYQLCGNLVLFKVLYQLISFRVSSTVASAADCALRARRIRLATELIRVVGEYFGEGKSRERMDCFLIYLLRFFYEAQVFWDAQYAAEYGGFPQEIGYTLQKLLVTFRKKDRAKFPQSLEEANEAVQRLVEKYVAQADAILLNSNEGKSTSDFAQPEILEEEEKIERKKATEEEEEEEERETESGRQSVDRATPASSATAGDVAFPSPTGEEITPPFCADTEEAEEAAVLAHQNVPVVSAEDEEFLFELDRALTETYQLASVLPKVPMVELEVPPSARQKFERKITFTQDTKPAETDSAANNNDAAAEPRVQMALMTRKGNRTVLKAVNLEPSQRMHEALIEQKERNDRERREMKKITLAMDDRIYRQQQEETLQRNATRNGFQLNLSQSTYFQQNHTPSDSS